MPTPATSPLILDDLSTGARAFTRGQPFYQGDIADGALINRVFNDHPDIAAVAHCAAHIVVPESVADPLRYYHNNVAKTIALLQHLTTVGCRRLLFSSSAAIYAPGPDLTVDEDSPIAPCSPYARSKAIVEDILRDVGAARLLSTLSLRYFNPIGADPHLRTGLQVPLPSHALGKLIHAHQTRTPFTITGVHWPTRDGTAIRDYIHVWDLARAHVHALERFDQILPGPGGYEVINVGTGRGTTVRELLTAFETVVGDRLDVLTGPPRPGDVLGSYTRNDKARRLLAWAPQLTITQAIGDSLAWSGRRDGLLDPSTASATETISPAAVGTAP